MKLRYPSCYGPKSPNSFTRCKIDLRSRKGRKPEKPDEKKTINDLPIEIRMHLFSYIEPGALKQLRLVCSSWRTTVDILVGLPVILDDSIRGNTLFIESVAKTSILVKNLRKGTAGVLNPVNPIRPHLLKSIVMSGMVRDNVLNDIKAYKFLRKLVLEEYALSRSICSSNENSELFFENLRVLQLRSFSVCFLIYHGFHVNEKMTLTIAKNLYQLLFNIKAPQLKAFAIDGDIDQFDLPTSINWKLEPLRKFLNNHSSSLERLFIGENNVIEVDGLVDYKSPYDQVFPKKLKSLYVSLQGVNQSLYWCKLIQDQYDLEHLDIGLIDYPFCFDMLLSLPSTITILSLFYNFHPEEYLDMTVFSKFTFLKKLELVYDGGRPVDLVNFSILSQCIFLTDLDITQCLIKTHYLESLNTILPKLESIYFLRIAHQRTRSQGYKISLKALQSILTLRKLSYFYCDYRDFGDTIGNATSMSALMKELSTTNHLFFFIGEEDSPCSHYHHHEEFDLDGEHWMI